MPRFACPQCKTILTVDEEQRGTVVECDCGKRMKVPAAKAVAPRAGAASAPRPPAPRDADDRARRAPARRAPLPDTAKLTRRPAPPAPPRDDDAEPSARKRKRRRKRQVAVSVLSSIGGLIVIAAFILIITGEWVDLIWEPLQGFLERQGIHPILALGVSGVLVFIPVGLLIIWMTKSSILDNIPGDLEFVAADVNDEAYEDLDHKRLQAYTEALKAEGFTPLMDYRVQTDIDGFPTGFARLFVNEDQHCFAEINQAFLPGGSAVPMRCNVMSILEDGWTLSATNRVTSKESYMMRRPRALWQSRPDDKPAQLVAAHLKARRRLVRDLEIGVEADDTADAYFEHERRANRERRKVVQGRWGLGIVFEMWFFDKNPRTEWWGDYYRRRSDDEE